MWVMRGRQPPRWEPKFRGGAGGAGWPNGFQMTYSGCRRVLPIPALVAAPPCTEMRDLEDKTFLLLKIRELCIGPRRQRLGRAIH